MNVCNQIAPRIQIAVERVKPQQNQVTRVARQLHDLRRELENRRLEQTKVQQRIQSLESQSGQSADPGQRIDVEDLSTILSLEAELAEKSVQQALAGEGGLTSQLYLSRRSLTELNDRIDQLERSLITP